MVRAPVPKPLDTVLNICFLYSSLDVCKKFPREYLAASIPLPLLFRLTLRHESSHADDNQLDEIADIVHDCGCDLAFFGCQVEHLEDILESLRAVVKEVSR